MLGQRFLLFSAHDAQEDLLSGSLSKSEQPEVTHLLARPQPAVIKQA